MKHTTSVSAISILFLICTVNSVTAQPDRSVAPYGDVRLIYSGTSTDAHGIGGKNPFFRIRAGLQTRISPKHTFAARLAYTATRNLNRPDFRLQAQGKLAGDTFSFDEFYYKYSDENQQLKLGRFQKSFSMPSATANSIMRFQSSSVSVNWSDGLFYQRSLTERWQSEMVLEYQKKGNLTFPYKAPLSFAKNEHNLTAYAGITDKKRDKYNFIEKTVAVLWAPGAFWYNGKFKDYLAIGISAAADLPLSGSQSGSSVRFTGEAGPNLMTKLNNGFVYSFSAGIYNIAKQHNVMIEIAGSDRYWLTAPYAVNSNTYELRYNWALTNKLSVDARYQIQQPRGAGLNNVYSTFIRATYSL